jgi:hypothetical protein
VAAHLSAGVVEYHAAGAGGALVDRGDEVGQRCSSARRVLLSAPPWRGVGFSYNRP